MFMDLFMNRRDFCGSSLKNTSSLMAFPNQGLVSIHLPPHNQRTCVHCRTTRTPLWRAGPAGPRSLCNACGIRYRKMKNNIGGGVNKIRKGKKMVCRMVGFGRSEILLHRATTAMADNGVLAETIGEEEQAAAMLLMALSSGRVR